MYGFMLFLHLTGLFFWLGSILSIVVMLRMLKSQLDQEYSKQLSKRIISVFNRFAHPASLTVLLSGVYMIIQLNAGTDKPFWLDIMEKGGGTIILLYLILTGILGSRMKKRLSTESSHSVTLSGYVTTMSIFFLAIMGLVLIVSMKL